MDLFNLVIIKNLALGATLLAYQKKSKGIKWTVHIKELKVSLGQVMVKTHQNDQKVYKGTKGENQIKKILTKASYKHQKYLKEDKLNTKGLRNI